MIASLFRINIGIKFYNYYNSLLKYRSLLLFRNLSLHFLNHLRQLFFAFLTGWGVDIMGSSFALGIPGRVFALPKVVIDLVHAAGAGFTVLGFVGLEIGLLEETQVPECDTEPTGETESKIIYFDSYRKEA
ncbi:MAG: hypothetical protein MJ075_05165 [Oscillospiraceae bacterium]|nr:hypothetical protein [Oscillospiraceae bacterium]